MTLKIKLRDNRDAILDRWLRATMDTYAKDTSSFLGREKDRFANPVGHSLRTGTRGILDGLLEGVNAEEICRHLNEIIKIRAIQDFAPSRAVSFVFLLKDAIRAELGRDGIQRFSSELTQIDAEIDQVALFAFDIYSRCREQVTELRINEVKRSVAAIMQRYAGVDPDSDIISGPTEDGTSCQGGGR
jgi:hypothetical protein